MANELDNQIEIKEEIKTEQPFSFDSLTIKIEPKENSDDETGIGNWDKGKTCNHFQTTNLRDDLCILNKTSECDIFSHPQRISKESISVRLCDATRRDSKCLCIVCSLLSIGFSNLSFAEKQEIIFKSRPTPDIHNLTKQSKSYPRHFQKQNYKKCEWLTGCNVKSRLFCWPCLLFSYEKSVWNSKGFGDLNNLHKLLKRHETSKVHIYSIVKEKTFGRVKNENSLDDELIFEIKKHNEEVRKNREILKRLIDVVCFLGEHELPFCGYGDAGNSLNEGNYVDLINMFAKYDDALKFSALNSTILNDSSSVIQNDLILCIREVLMQRIKREIENTSFVAVILSDTSGLECVSQLSKVVRYVTANGEVKEHFLGFANVSTQRTAEVVHDIIQTMVHDLNCGSKVIAQSYDGATVMASELEELQAKLRETYPHALFVYGIPHRLNLLLQQSLNIIKECRMFFSILNGLSAFFSQSSKRTNALDLKVNIRLPKLSLNHWNFDNMLPPTVSELRQPLIDLFTDILENPEDWDNETISCSQLYLDMLEHDRDFNFLLILFSEIFPYCDNLFSVLANKMTDVHFCIKSFNECTSAMLSTRAQFESFWTKFQQLHLRSEYQIKIERLDTTLGGSETSGKDRAQKLFFDIIDTISLHLDIRFKNFSSLKFLELINFNANTTVLQAAFDSLQQIYPDYFDFSLLQNELSVIYNTEQGLNKNSTSELWKSLKECELDQACQETLKMCELALTISAVSISTNRCLSVYDRIKNFLTNTTEHEMMPALAILSVERELLQKMTGELSFYDVIIDEFAKRNETLMLNFK